MAARRLVIVMLVMLGISTLAAALVPPPPDRGTATGTTDTTTGTTEGTGATGTATTATTGAQGSGPPDSATATATETPPLASTGGALKRVTITAKRGRVSVVPIDFGDQLRLTVKVARPETIEIPGLGRVEPADAFAPAQFDLLIAEPGTYPIRLFNGQTVIGRIEVSARARAE